MLEGMIGASVYTDEILVKMKNVGPGFQYQQNFLLLPAKTFPVF
jgi:hypothetical protein